MFRLFPKILLFFIYFQNKKIKNKKIIVRELVTFKKLERNDFKYRKIKL
jgi:hypothetical protein